MKLKISDVPYNKQRLQTWNNELAKIKTITVTTVNNLYCWGFFSYNAYKKDFQILHVISLFSVY